MQRIAVGGILHETHTFAPVRTDLAAFARQALYEDEALLANLRGAAGALDGSLARLDRAGYQPVPLLYAAAMPAGLVTAEAYETLVTGLLNRLATALPVDGVLLALHGAMVAEGEDDCEGDILRRVRGLVGPGCPVVSTLDMHGNLSPAMVAAADVLVAYDRNPHLDTFARGLEAAAILRRMLEEGLRPARAMVKLPLLLSALTTWTEQPPLRPVHERGQVLEQDPAVVNVSVFGGYAYADTPFSGVSILVTTAGDESLAGELARELAAIAWSHREAATHKGLPVAEAVGRALRAPAGPVILADVGDNVGGGSPGDGTVLLAGLLAAGAEGAVVTLADPEAVACAWEAGAGAAVELTIGGKADRWHGEPVRLRGEVERLTDGRYTNEGTDHFASLYGREVQMGRCAVLRSQGVRLLLTERKTPPGDLAQLRSQGITPEAQRIIVVKSAVAFRGAYGPIAGEIIEVDTPGLCTADLSRFPYRKLSRPVFPLDDVPDALSLYRSYAVPALSRSVADPRRGRPASLPRTGHHSP
jgi:microcystin degradation protein MlrC